MSDRQLKIVFWVCIIITLVAAVILVGEKGR